MNRVRADNFLQIDEAGLSDYADACGAEMELMIAAPFRASVLENLTALQVHARRVSAALQDLNTASAEARQI